MPPHRVSIIITNYNYGQFIADAIRSALAVEYEDREIIVCDDGSTDASRAVIESFGGQIDKVLFKENGGQASAANHAYQHATGDIILFLDADDLLMPQTVTRLLEVWRPGISKVQFPLLNIDQNGRANGTMFPNFAEAYAPEEIRRLLLQTGLYPSPPTTGNAWSRDFLDHVFPLPDTGLFLDTYLVAVAPLYGDVVTLLDPLGFYRIHGNNVWAQKTFDPAKFALYVKQDCLRTEYLREKAGELGYKLNPDPLRHNAAHLMFRLVCLKFAPEAYPYPGETVLRTLRHAIPAVLQHERPIVKVLLVQWLLAVALLPRPLSLPIAKMRFAARSRPEFIVKTLRLLGVLRRTDVRAKTRTLPNFSL